MESVRRAPSGIIGGAKFGKVSKDGPGSRECTKEDRERYAQQGRQWRNSDLWFESVDLPHGLCGVDDELVGLDVNTVTYKGAHFATFPPKLIEPLIKSGTSEWGCCHVCLEPWRRVLEKTDQVDGSHRNSRFDTGKTGKRDGGDRTQSGERFVSQAIGWEPGCDCDTGSPVPCTVLDPFLGSGTTAAVAQKHGRHCIGIELNPEYIELAKSRFKQRVLPMTG